MRNIALALMLLCLLPLAFAADEHSSTIAASPAFDKMKTLVGAWDGTMLEGGKEMPATASFKIVSDGSALMGYLGEGTPYEMVTMFHMDGARLMATHYCAAHNQPRLVVEKSDDPNHVTFRFLDGTNLGPHDGHMEAVTFIFDGANHHIEEWTYKDPQGKLSTGRFDFRRKS